jgi:drug/metabolite transporter (DMT)-like permease
MLSFGQAVLFWVEKYISSGLTAVYVSTLPIWYIITDKKHRRNYFKSKLTLLSILLGVTGITVLFIGGPGISTQGSSGMVVLASLLTFVSCYCWAIGSLYFKYHHREGSLYSNVGWQLIGGTVACLIISYFIGETENFSFKMITINSWLAVLYLAIAGSIIAFIAMYWLLARKPAPVVGTYAYVNPVIAVLIGYFFANETITGIQVAGIIIILVAAYLANNIKNKVEKP